MAIKTRLGQRISLKKAVTNLIIFWGWLPGIIKSWLTALFLVVSPLVYPGALDHF